jgi:hypothetical protein
MLVFRFPPDVMLRHALRFRLVLPNESFAMLYTEL